MATTRSVSAAWRRVLGLLAVPLVAGVAVLATFTSSSGGGTGPPQSPTNSIQIQSFSFHPSTVTVAAGAMVTVANRDGTAHTVTAGGGAFDTHDIGGGNTTSIVAPKQPGTYAYRCNIHQYMRGVLQVRG